MRKTLFIIAFFAAFTANAQIVAWGPGTWVWTNGAPAHNPGQTGSKYAIDTVTFKMYEWSGTGTAWTFSGWRIQNISGCASPAFTPGKHDSQIVINGCDSLYYYRGGAWRHLNAGGSGGGGSGTVSIFNFTDGNGFDGTVVNGTTTPTLSLATTATGILQGSGGAISAVTVGSGLAFGSGTLSNSAPDQTVTITGATGTYPTFSLPLVAVGEGYGIDISGTTTRTITVDTAQVATLYDVSQANQTVTAGTGISVSQTGQNYTVTNTGDLSATNELQTISTGTNTLTLSNGGGTVTVDTDPTNDITGTVANNNIPKGNGTTALQTSQTYDNGTTVSVATSSPLTAGRLEVSKSYSNTTDANIVATGNIPLIGWRTTTYRFAAGNGYEDNSVFTLLGGASGSNPTTPLMSWWADGTQVRTNATTFNAPGGKGIFGSTGHAFGATSAPSGVSFYVNVPGSQRVRFQGNSGLSYLDFYTPSSGSNRNYSFATSYFSPGDFVILKSSAAGTDPDTKLISFDVDNRTTLGGTALVLPNLTAAQIAALTTVIEGTIVYNTTTKKFQGWDGTVWIPFY